MIPLSWIIGGVSTLALSVALFFSHAEVNHLRDEIDNPKTGYVVRLAQSETNTHACQTALDDQNNQWQAKSDADEARLAVMAKAYESNRAATDAANRAVGAFLAHRPAGATLLERYESVDAQVLGDLR